MRRRGLEPPPGVTGLEPESGGPFFSQGNKATNAEHYAYSARHLQSEAGIRSADSKGATKGTSEARDSLGQQAGANDKRSRRLLYFVWRKMVARCTDPADPAFCRYGARGIFVSPTWSTWPGFLVSLPAGYGRGLQLDRIDNDGPYSPENCRWATRRENQANTRKTRLIEAFGEVLPLREWSRRTGIHHSVIARRLDKGISPDVALGIGGAA